ncbi:MAG TPA: MtnX-like HAD-IB family phosphatase [Tepidisphaeraceae bacterium]
MPKAGAAQVFIDFDGTLSSADVVDQLIVRYSINENWKALEKLWQLKEIGSRQCLSEELAAVRINEADLEKFLKSISLDAGAVGLLELLQRHGVPTLVLSDGLDVIIQTILRHHGISDLPVRCNRMTHRGDQISLSFPYENADCESAAGHCKCSSARACAVAERKAIYIGDGRSDLCAARKADYVFAKGELARCLEADGIHFERYTSLDDVRRTLQIHWQAAVSTK